MSMAYVVPLSSDAEIPHKLKAEEAKDQERGGSTLSTRDEKPRSLLALDKMSSKDRREQPSASRDSDRTGAQANAHAPALPSAPRGPASSSATPLHSRAAAHSNPEPPHGTPASQRSLLQEHAEDSLWRGLHDDGSAIPTDSRRHGAQRPTAHVRGDGSAPAKGTMRQGGEGPEGGREASEEKRKRASESGAHTDDGAASEKLLPSAKEGRGLGSEGLRRGGGPAAEDGAAAGEEPVRGAAMQGKKKGLREAQHAGKPGGGVLGKRERAEEEDGEDEEGEEGEEEEHAEDEQDSQATGIQSVDNTRSGGIDGIFRTVGITRRRTRPNRFSNRSVAKPLALTSSLAAKPKSEPECALEGGDQGQLPVPDSKLAATESKSGSDAREGAVPVDSPGSAEEEGAGGDEREEGPVGPRADGSDGPAGDEDEDEEAALAARVKQEGRERREKAKKKRGEDDVMFWGDWVPPPALRPPHLRSHHDEGGKDPEAGGGGGRQKPKRSKGANGSPDLHGEEQALGGGGAHALSEGLEGGNGQEERHVLHESSGPVAGEKAKSRGRGRPRKTPPKVDDGSPAARHASAVGVASLIDNPSGAGVHSTMPPPLSLHRNSTAGDHSAHQAGAAAAPGGRVSPSPLQRSPPPSPSRAALGPGAAHHVVPGRSTRRTSRSPPPPSVSAAAQRASAMVTRQRCAGRREWLWHDAAAPSQHMPSPTRW